MDGKSFQLSGYDVDIIVHGFPGKSVCHGSLGFCSIALIGHRDRLALIDVGSFGQRMLLQEELAKRDLSPNDITDVLLTHSHYDHSVNWVMFHSATVAIGSEELNWSLSVPWESSDKCTCTRRGHDARETRRSERSMVTPCE